MIASSELPAGLDAWVHFSAIEADGFRVLAAGDRVSSDEEARQDGFLNRVSQVRILPGHHIYQAFCGLACGGAKINPLHSPLSGAVPLATERH